MPQLYPWDHPSPAVSLCLPVAMMLRTARNRVLRAWWDPNVHFRTTGHIAWRSHLSRVVVHQQCTPRTSLGAHLWQPANPESSPWARVRIDHVVRCVYQKLTKMLLWRWMCTDRAASLLNASSCKLYNPRLSRISLSESSLRCGILYWTGRQRPQTDREVSQNTLVARR